MDCTAECRGEVLAEAARFVGDSVNVAKKKRECIRYQFFLTLLNLKS